MVPLDSTPSALQTHLKRLWIHGFLAGFGVLLVICLICLFIWGWPTAAPEGPEEARLTPSQTSTAPVTTPAPAPTTTVPPSAEVKPPASLEVELKEVLDRLEKANQKKDLQQLLSLYSPTFPDLPKKAQEISRSWASFDYLRLRYKLTDIESSTPDRASARVIWEIKTRHRQSREIKDTTKIYLVRFTCESGRWCIQSLEKVGKVAGRDKSL